ncbi:MAG: hypothetical protein K0U54_06680 [Bacteroidetes bacterium]|nr:hypothetical protein [Bacteroidota bacterium]
MKHAIMSIVIAVLGLCFLLYLSKEVAAEYMKLSTHQQLNEPILIVTPKVHRMASIIIGLVGIFFGIKGFQTTTKISSIGMLLSIVLIILSVLPLWTYFVHPL